MRKFLIIYILLLIVENGLHAQNCSINAGINATICYNDSMILNGTRSGLFASNSISTWTQISGPSVIINSPNSLTTKVVGFSAGEYKFKLSIKCKDGYIAEDSAKVTVLPLSISNAGRDSLYCPFGQLSLNANTPQNGESGLWTIVSSNSAGISIASPTNPLSTFTLNPNASGVTKLRWTITSINGCFSFSEINITNSGGVMPIDAGPDQILGNCFSNTTCTNLSASNGGNGLGGQQGAWTFISGPSVPTINSPFSPKARVCNLIEGTYVFRYTVVGPCANGFDDVSVTVPPATQDVTPANANSFASSTTYCGIVNTISLNGNTPLYAGETVFWTQTSGPAVTINNSTSPSATVTGINAFGSYCFKYSIINTVSQCISSSIVCYTFYTIGTVDGGPDQILACNVTSTTIPTTITGTGVLNYTVISGPSGPFTYPANFRGSNVITGMTAPGTYRVEINYQFGAGCSPISDFVDITVSRPPTGSNAGTDQYFACSSTSTQLAGNNPVITGLGTGRWSQISGPNISTLVTPTNYICNIKGTIPGTYTYRWTITGGNKCPDNFDDIKVIIPDTLVSKANAGTDKIICPNSSLTLQGNTVRADENVVWSSIPAGVTFSPSSTIPNPTISGFTGNTTYQFIYTITNSCGTISKDTVLVTTSNSAGPSGANAGPDQCLPSGTTVIKLHAVNPSSGVGNWTQISGPNTNITNPSLDTTTVTGVLNGNYKFIWKITSPGCLNSSEDTVLITVSGNTTISNAGIDITACANSVTLNANAPVTGNGIWSQISGDGGAIINNVLNPVTTVSNLTTGVYNFRWTITNGVCSSNHDDVKVTISSPPSISNAGPDQTLCGVNANNTILNATVPVIGTGQWVQVSGPNTAIINNRNLANTSISNLTNGSYTFRWIIAEGPNCPQSTDDVVVNVSLPANAGADQNLCNLSSTTLTGNTGSNGIWSKISGPNVTITQSPAGNPIASVSGLLPSSTYTFRYTIPSLFGCPSTFDDVIIKNGAFTFVPDAGPDDSYCNATSFDLNGSQPSQGETGAWSVLSGPSGAVFTPSANVYNAILTGVTPGTYILKWTISNAICSSSDQKRIDNYAPPSNSNAGADQVVCYNKAVLTANTPTVGIGTWTQISGPVVTTIAAINNPISQVSGLNTVGVYNYVWTISNSSLCAFKKDTVKLIVSALSPSIANAGIDKSLCSLQSIQLNGNTPVSGNGTWSEIGTNSTSIIVLPGSPTTTVDSLNSGTHQFVWTIANADNSCLSSDTVIIFNSVKPNSAKTSPDDTFCVFNSIFLNANAAIAGTSGLWTFISGPSTPGLLTPTNPTCQIIGVVTGTYKFRWTISSLSCPSSSDDVNITVINNADNAIAGSDQNLCTQSINLFGNTPTGINRGIWSQFSGPTNATFVSNTNPNTIVTNLIPGIYRFVWEIYNARCFTTDTVTFIINQPALSFAGNDTSVCNNISSIALTSASVSSANGKGTWSIISGGGTLSTTVATTTPYNVIYTPQPNYIGAVILRLTAQDACHLVSDDITILLNQSSVPISAVNDFTNTDLNTPVIINVLTNDIIHFDDTLDFCQQNAIAINPTHGSATINFDGTITYSPQGNFSGTDSFQYQICTQHNPDSSWSSHCYKEGADSAWVFVTVSNDDCFIPNAFSPNRDGINDAFKIECGTELHISIFNSWGIEVYRSEDYQNDWEGTYKGAPLPDGTYFYSLKYKWQTNELLSRAGFICLHR